MICRVMHVCEAPLRSCLSIIMIHESRNTRYTECTVYIVMWFSDRRTNHAGQSQYTLIAWHMVHVDRDAIVLRPYTDTHAYTYTNTHTYTHTYISYTRKEMRVLYIRVGCRSINASTMLTIRRSR